MKRVRQFLFENSIFLIAGSICALIWANLNPTSYGEFVHLDLLGFLGESSDHHAAHGHDDHSHGFTLHFLVNDVLMALFFAIAAKEVWEAALPGGSLSDIRKAATPLLGTIGGILGPAVVYLLGAFAFGRFHDLGSGWAVPCATDIAFSYLVAKLIFGNGHPAIAFLLLLAIADDAAGLAILAVFYPTGETNFYWFGLTVFAIVTGLTMKRKGVNNFWWYLLVPGVLSWISFYMSGLHAALGLVPIIPTMPTAKRDEGLFVHTESDDTLNAFEHWWKNPVELILGLFALVNAGVVVSSFGAGTALVTLGLFIGKPLGIFGFTWLAVRMLGLKMAEGMQMKHVFVLGCIASLGFTVALFVSTAAFPTAGFIQDSVKMGALLSFLAPVTAFAAAFLVGIRPACLGPARPGRQKTTTASTPAKRMGSAARQGHTSIEYVLMITVVLLVSGMIATVGSSLFQPVQSEAHRMFDVDHPGTTASVTVAPEWMVDGQAAWAFWSPILFTIVCVLCGTFIGIRFALHRRPQLEQADCETEDEAFIQDRAEMLRNTIYDKRGALMSDMSRNVEEVLDGKFSVEHLMSRRMKVIRPDMPAQKVRDLIAEHKLHHLLVCENHRLVGVISDRDLFTGEKANYASDLMTKDPITVSPSHLMIPTVSTMISKRISCLPVTEDGKLMGVLTRTDLLVAFQCLLNLLKKIDHECADGVCKVTI